VPSQSTDLPEEEGFAWQVLSALTTHAEFAYTDGILAVSMTMHSTVDA
jgi:serine/threonine-protein kinase RsbW